MRELPERAGSAFAATSASDVFIFVSFRVCLFSGIGRHLFVIKIMDKQNQLSRNCDAKLQPFLVPPELFPKCIGSSQFGTNTYFLVGYAANLFLRMASMQRLVLVMLTRTDVRYSVRPCFLWFACA